MAANEYAPVVDPKEGLFAFSDFMGLRNNVGPNTFIPGDLVTALNVDITDSLDIERRKGYSAPVTSAIDRDLWASGATCLGVGTNALKLVNPDYSTATLYAGLTPSRPLSYAAVADRVFWSNGIALGCVQNGANRTWGMTLPGLPSIAAGPGALALGKYQVAITYLCNDGQESGTGRAATIELTSLGGISLSSILASTDPRVTHKVIYATSVGGETLYQVGGIPNSQTTFLIDEVRAGASPCITQFLSPPPAGDFVAESRGHMLVASGNRLYPSEPYAMELFDLRKSFPFNDAITMIAPINDGKIYRQHGLYVGTNSQLIWLEGDSPFKWEYRVLANYGVIPGTLFFGDGELLGAGDSKEKIAFFATARGLCAGKMGGDFVNLTQHRFAYPSMDRGAGIVRRHRGIAQFLVSMQGTESVANVAA
jgi:hypothetical protein